MMTVGVASSRGRRCVYLKSLGFVRGARFESCSTQTKKTVCVAVPVTAMHTAPISLNTFWLLNLIPEFTGPKVWASPQQRRVRRVRICLRLENCWQAFARIQLRLMVAARTLGQSCEKV